MEKKQRTNLRERFQAINGKPEFSEGMAGFVRCGKSEKWRKKIQKFILHGLNSGYI